MATKRKSNPEPKPELEEPGLAAPSSPPIASAPSVAATSDESQTQAQKCTKLEDHNSESEGDIPSTVTELQQCEEGEMATAAIIGKKAFVLSLIQHGEVRLLFAIFRVIRLNKKNFEPPLY